jgi:acyl carrier protein
VTVEDRIRELIVSELRYQGGRDSLTDDFPLIDEHVIDSLDLLKLVSLIEQEFNLEVDDEDLVPSNFGTIGDITRFISAKKGA